MEYNYRTSSRRWLLAGGLFMLAVGILPFAVVLQSLPGEVSGGSLGWEDLLLLLVLPFVIPLWFARKCLLQEVYQVRVNSNGAFTFEKFFGTTHISASDILRVDFVGARLGFEDADNRQVWIVHKRGSVLIPYYNKVERIVSELTRHNPGINIVREW